MLLLAGSKPKNGKSSENQKSHGTLRYFVHSISAVLSTAEVVCRANNQEIVCTVLAQNLIPMEKQVTSQEFTPEPTPPHPSGPIYHCPLSLTMATLFYALKPCQTNFIQSKSMTSQRHFGLWLNLVGSHN